MMILKNVDFYSSMFVVFASTLCGVIVFSEAPCSSLVLNASMQIKCIIIIIVLVVLVVLVVVVIIIYSIPFLPLYTNIQALLSSLEMVPACRYQTQGCVLIKRGNNKTRLFATGDGS